jgi:hypothetical protein
MNILKHQPRTLGQDAGLFVLMGGDHDEVGGSMVGTPTAIKLIMKTVLACIREDLYAELDKSYTDIPSRQGCPFQASPRLADFKPSVDSSATSFAIRSSNHSRTISAKHHNPLLTQHRETLRIPNGRTLPSGIANNSRTVFVGSFQEEFALLIRCATRLKTATEDMKRTML